MAHVHSNDPLASITGLTPRYLRMRQAGSQRPTAQPQSETPAPTTDDAELFANLVPVDAVTPDLRRRVMSAAAPGRRASLVIAGPMTAGLCIMLWQLVSNIAHSMPVTAPTGM
jgi:hypothetical protein